MSDQAVWAGLTIAGTGAAAAAIEQLLVPRFVDQSFPAPVALLRHLPEACLALSAAVIVGGIIAEAL